MISNIISWQKYVFEHNVYNSSPILELSVKFASQISHEYTNTPLNVAYLADFGIDIIVRRVRLYVRWIRKLKLNEKGIPFAPILTLLCFSCRNTVKLLLLALFFVWFQWNSTISGVILSMKYTNCCKDGKCFNCNLHDF